MSKSIESLEANGVEENVQKEVLVLSRCGNCCREFENDTEKIAKINIGTVDHYQNESGNTIHDGKISLTAVQVLSRIYGFPLNCSQEGSWSENDDCSLCQKCVDALTDFYQAFLELHKLTNEASYISRGLNKIYKCIEKSFSSLEKETEIFNEKRQNETSTNSRQKRVSKKSAFISPRKVKDAQVKSTSANSDSKKSDPGEGRPQENVDGAGPACILEVKLETFQGSSETLQGDSPTKESEQKQEDISEELIRGSTEVISPTGQVIRQSTRARKIRKLIDLEESIQPKPVVIRSGEKRSKNGRFICPEPICLKAFKGMKTLNKHVTQHVGKTVVVNLTEDTENSSKCEDQNSTTSKLAALEDSTEEIQAKIVTSSETSAISQDKRYKCEHCDKKFLLKKMFEKHLLSHENQRAQCRCTICHKKFSTAFSLARHISSIHDANESNMSNKDDKMTEAHMGAETSFSIDSDVHKGVSRVQQTPFGRKGKMTRLGSRSDPKRVMYTFLPQSRNFWGREATPNVY